MILLLNPLYIGMLNFNEPNWYRYEASQVAFEDDHVNSSVEVRSFDSEVACLDRNFRTCLLEQYVLENDGVNYSAELAAGPGSGYRYAYLDGEFYQVQPQRLGGNGTLSLGRLEREEALGYIATPVDRASPEIQTAVHTGSVTAHHSLSGANELIRAGENYYVVHNTASQVYHGDAYDREKRIGQFFQYGLMGVGIGIGLWLVLRGQRERVLR